MRYLKIFILIFVLMLSLNADEKNNEESLNMPSKIGFLATKWCIENGYFKDCRLESYLCGEGECYKKHEPTDSKPVKLVLFVHEEGKAYEIDISKLPRYEFDKALNRNDVEIIGEIKDDVIKADKIKAPSPPKKSFFKGCL